MRWPTPRVPSFSPVWRPADVRLLDLALTRWGPFTDRRLPFDPAATLVVVHGRNEAGKSSALAGLVDALYGIETRSRFNFLHDYANLRVGATLARMDGGELAFQRRKGNRATLRDAGDQPLPDEALLPFLGTVDRSLFVTAFALNQDALRRGGDALARGGGSLGEALAAAAPGLGRLVALRKTLAEEATALFTERRAGGKPFYVALDAWQSARASVAKLSLSADAIAKAEAAVTGAEALVAQRDEARRAARAALARQERLQRALPRLAEIDRLNEALAASTLRPVIDDGFAASVEALGKRRERMNGERSGLVDERESLAATLATLRTDAPLLAAGPMIDRLAAGRSRRLAAAADRSDCAAAVDRALPALDAAARRLGLAAAAALPTIRPSAVAIARLRALMQDRAGLDARAADVDRRRRALAVEQARIAEDAAAAAMPEDPRGARATLTDLAALGPALRNADAAAATLAMAAARTAEAAEVLRARGLPPDALATSALPDRRSVEAAQRAIDAADRAAAEATRTAEAARRRSEEAEERRSRLAAGEPPTPVALAAQRALRTAAWDRVRGLLFDGGAAAPGERHEAARALDQAIDAADRLADRRTEAAEAVAALIAAADAADRARIERDRAEGEATERGRVATATRRAFAASLLDAGLPDLAPEAVLHLLDRHGDLVAARAAEAKARSEHAVARADVDRLRDTLARLAAQLGVTAAADEPPTALLPRVRAAVDAREATWQAARERERVAAEASRRLAEIEAEAATLADLRAALAADWAAATAAVGIAADARPEEGEAAVQVWSDIAEIETRLRDDRARIARLDAEIAAYDADARTLAVDLDLPPALGAPDSVIELARRLAETRAVADRRRVAEERFAVVGSRLAALDREANAIATEDLRLRTLADVPPSTALADAVSEARAAAELTARLAAVRREIASDGASEADLRAAAAEMDADRLAAEIASRHEDLARRDAEMNEAVAERTRAHRALDDIARQDGAVAAGQAAENALAEAAEIAERWRTLQAAARLAGSVIEEYRRSHQNPVLSEASNLFATISAGRYPSLVADYDEDGDARLVALRTTAAA